MATRIIQLLKSIGLGSFLFAIIFYCVNTSALIPLPVPIIRTSPRALPPPSQTPIPPHYIILPSPKVPAQFTMTDSFAPMMQPQEYPSAKLQRLFRPVRLSLRDAIILALRYNPNVENSELTRIINKYTLLLAQREFVPRYTLGGGATFTSGSTPVYTINSSVSVRTPIGTTYTLGYNNTFPVTNNGSNFGMATFTVMQPLLQGFGFVNRINLLNAYDAEESARLTFKNNIITTVNSVIQNYRALVSAYNNLETQSRNVKETKIQIRQYRLMFKAGRMSRSDLIQQLAQLSQSELSYEQQRFSVEQSYRTFLVSLGLTANANIKIDKTIRITPSHIPSLREALNIAFQHNIPYAQALIALKATERAVITAHDQQLPTLNVTASETFMPDNGVSPGRILSPFQPLQPPIPPLGAGMVRNRNTASVVGVTFAIPIDNVEGKAAFVEAQVAVTQAKLALDLQKETLIQTITNDITQLQSLRQQIRISEENVRLQRKTYQDYLLKLRYGRATVFETTQNQDLLLNAELTLIGIQIQYLNQIDQLYTDMGETLNKWDIKLRY